MKTIAIVEDTIDNLEVIRYFLKKQYPDLQLVGEARSVDDAYDLLTAKRPVIALLDIQIIGGTSFDVLSRMDEAGQPFPQLIFITAHGVVENATKALRYAALDFITKPIDQTQLGEALARAVARADAQETMLDEIRAMLDQQRRGDRFDRIAIRLVGGIRRLVTVNELVYFEADREMTRVFLASGAVLSAAVNLGHFTRTLQTDYDFLLVHQSQLVNADYIRQFNPRAGEVELTTGHRIATSQRGTALLRAYFQRKEDREPVSGGLLARLKSVLGGWQRGPR